jgi:LuxR family transcriptional regulator, quorum-sensing system regulator CviR
MNAEPNLSQLSKPDLLFLLGIAERSLGSCSADEVRQLLTEVGRQLPTSGVIAGHLPGAIGSDTLARATFINVSFPEEWLSEYQRRNYFFSDPVKNEWAHGRTEYQIWSDTYARVETDTARRFIRHAREYGLEDGVTVGVHQRCSGQSSFFSFGGRRLPTEPRHLTMLRYLAPYLHEALCRRRPDAASATPSGGLLSDREREVLSWAKAGKTNWEISVILHISERTVKFHVQNAMRKLQASTRAHAVAVALAQGDIGH